MIKAAKIPFILLSVVATMLIGTSMRLSEHTDDLYPLTVPPISISSQISTGNDDVEEYSDGTMYMTSSDLELVDDEDDNDFDQTIGLRFTNIQVPAGKVITSAYIEFEVDETDSGTTDVYIRAEDIDDAPAFTTTNSNLSSRTPTSEFAYWSIPAWNTTSQKQNSVDISNVIQEVVDRGGWSTGNDIAIIITGGNGTRTAEAYEGESANAATLYITYDDPVVICGDTYPYNESWETDFGIWEQDAGDDGDWTRQTGGTPSGSTGPSAAADGSNYIFTESSSVFNKTMIIKSCFDLTNECSATFNFDYHMYGATTGSLTLEISNDNETNWTSLFTLSGDQGNLWNAQSVNLSAYDGEEIVLKFTGLTGSSYTSDIALDNLSLTTGSCNVAENCGNNLDDDGDGAIDSDDPDCDTCSSTELTNRDFQNDLTAWSDWGGSSIITESNGNKYARTSGVAGGQGQNIPCAGGSTVTVSFYGKKDVGEWASAGFAGYNASGTKVFNDLTAPITTTSWSSYSVSSVVPNDVTDINVFLWKSAGAGSADVDGYCVTITPPAVVTCDIDPGSIADPVMDCNTNDPGIINNIQLAEAECNDLLNTEFDNGSANWSIYASNGASATWSVDNGSELSGTNSAYIDITAASTSAWHIEYYQNPVSTSTSETYDLSFEAKADGPRTMYVSIQLRESPWSDFWSTTVNLTTTAQTFSFNDISIPNTSTNMGMMFKMGLSSQNVYLDNIYFGEHDCGSPTINYKWQKREYSGGSWGSWTDIAGATSSAYNPNVITENTEYRRLAQVAGCATWEISNEVAADLCAVEDCTDGIDNDGDGDIDCDDSDCVTSGNAIAAQGAVRNGAATNATGAQNNTTTEVGSSSDYLVLTLADELPIGSVYTIHMSARGGSATTDVFEAPSGTTLPVSQQASPAGFTFNGQASSPVDVITAVNKTTVVATKYLYFDRGSGDIEIDAVTYIVPCNSVEDCTDGVDNDGDGDIDCDDADCGTPSITYTTNTTATNCPALDNGSIVIFASGSNLEYSIDNGTTYQASGTFTGLTGGNYTLRVRNSVTGCSVTETEYLTDPPCIEICDDGVDNDGDSLVDCLDDDCEGDNSVTFEISISSSTDDAEEETANGAMSLYSTDLELGTDGVAQEIGLRFRNFPLSTDAVITSAYLEFETDEIDSEATSVNIYGQDIDDAATFSNTAFDISSRTKTSASVAWNNIPTWGTVNGKHQSPDLSAIVQEVLDRSGWNSGNDIAFIIGGSGSRTAESYNGEPANAPKLVITYNYPSLGITSVSANDPTNCPGSDNGSISIVATGSNLEYSIDGGSSYQVSNSFTNLSAGSYDVVIRNNVTNCTVTYAANSVVLNAASCAEVCDDGIDNDGDGDIDCDDSDCGTPAITSVAPVDPTNCPALDNGSITIVASGSNLEYSIDNGSTYQSGNSFTGLSAGNYNVYVRNSATGCSVYFGASTAIVNSTECLTCTTTYPYSESFESNFGTWWQVQTDDHEWLRGSSTSSSGTGPNSASDGSTFAYMEASYGYNDNSVLKACFDLTNECSASFDFDYHMSGATMGTLLIELSDNDQSTWNTIFTQSGDQGTAWITENLDLTAYAGSEIIIRITGTSGTSYTSDIGLDNISLTTDCAEICDDGLDNDGDGDVDCDDADCGQPSISFVSPTNPDNCPDLNNGGILAIGSGSNLEYSINGGSTYQSSPSFVGLSAGSYAVRIRNSVTGCFVDYAANNVILTDPICVEICDDGIDNDGDGDIDCDDSDCGAASIAPYTQVGEGTWINQSTLTACDGDEVSIGSQVGLMSGLVMTLPDGSIDNSPTADSYFDLGVIDTSDVGTYTLTYTNANGCSSTQDIELIVSMPTITDVSSTYPDNCPAMDNGTLTITATGSNLQYSIDGGATWYVTNVFTGLTGGDYNLVVRNSVTLCTATYGGNPYHIAVPVCIEICDDGIDNDGDGDTDCDDSDCIPSVVLTTDDSSICPDDSTLITSTVCEHYEGVSMVRPYGNNGWNNEFDVGGSGITGDGTLCFTMMDDYFGSVQMIGLNSDPYTDDNWNSIDFGMYIVRRTDINKYLVYARESGVNLSTLYNSVNSIVGTELCIRRTGTTVEFLIDGVVEYTSITSSTGTLYYDNSFYSSATHDLYGGGYSYFDDISLCSTPDVTYAWSTTETTDSIYASASGTYTLTVTDSQGCTASDQIIITEETICTEICDDNVDNDGDGDIDCDDSDCNKPNLTNVSASSPTNCPALDNGTITITATGDNLEYSIDGGASYQSSGSFTGLTFGSYTVLVINTATGCTDTYAANDVILTEADCSEICDDNIDNDGDGDIDCDDSDCSPVINAVSYGHPDTCPSLNDGTISITASGANLEYSIDNGVSYQSSSSFTGLVEGSFTVVVRNSSSGCTVLFDANPINLNSPVCVEICNNGQDDDGDGDTDCNDTDCMPTIAISTDDSAICPSETITLHTEVCENYQDISVQRPLPLQGWQNVYGYEGSGISGDGELCFTLSDFNLSSLQTFGLNSDPDTDNNYNSIDFGINVAIRPDNNLYTLQIRENGTLVNLAYNSSTSFLNSTFCINRTGTTITYSMDGIVLYTSATASTGDLYYDHSIYSSTSSAIYIDGYSYFTDISLCGEIIESYEWNNASTADSLNVTTAGTYSVTYTGIHGCTATDNIVIAQDICPEICNDGIDNDSDGDIDCDDSDCGQPTITSISPVNPNNCDALNNGSITIIASGSNLEYSIDAGANYQSNNAFTNLTYGNYSIRVLNSATGCFIDHVIDIDLAQISCPEVCNDGIDNDLDGDIDCEDTDCRGPGIEDITVDNVEDCTDFNDGKIDIKINDDDDDGDDIEYSIDGGNTYGDDKAFPDLSPGTYNVFVRYVGSPCATEYAANPIIIAAINCPEICDDGIDNDGDGDIDCDDSDCSPVIEAITVKNADNCPNLTNGFIHINPLENNAYEYSIDGGTFYQNNKNFNGLTPGSYNVRVRRRNTNCYIDYENNPIIIIGENCGEICDDGIDNDGDGLIDCEDPDCFAPTISGIQTNNPSNCPDLDNGNININAFGPNLMYSINGGATYQANSYFGGLENGIYTITVLNSVTGCTIDYSSNNVVLADTPCPEICNDGIDNDGDGDIDCDDGECGMPTITSVNVANPDNCPLLNNGLITIQALGPNLEYSINGGTNYQANNVFSGMSDGTYTIRVRNSISGCFVDYANNNVSLTDPICVEICGDGFDNDGDGLTDCDDSDCETPAIINVSTNNPDNCPDLDNGSITILASGDDKEYSIDGGNTYYAVYQFNGLSAGNYDIRVRNTDTGCYIDHTSTITITDPVCIEICGNGIDDDGDGNADCDDIDCEAPVYVSISSTIADQCPNLNNGTITINASGNNLQYSINNGVTFQTSNIFTGLTGGEYTIVIKNGITGCEVPYPFNPYTVAEGECLEICNNGVDDDGDGLIDCEDDECVGATIESIVSVDPNNCPTLNNGTITINATGDALEYSITNGVIYQNSNVFTGLYKGSYTVVIRNKVTGCTLTYDANPVVLVEADCGEICDNGIDDDGDGQVDCADGDCGAPSSIGEDHTDPDNCYALNNGNILMSSVGVNVVYSIDGGTTWQADPSFDWLTAGTYYTQAMNSETGCITNGPTVILYASTCDEICDDGIDNDGDGLIDCADGNCGTPTIGLVTAYDPYNCPTLDNGTISITGSGNDLEFSIDNGLTYSSSSMFSGLVPGSYNIVLQNTSTGCTVTYPNNPVVLSDPICGEICDDGIDNDGDGDIDCEDSECVNASNTFKIDFDLDTPVITKLSDRVAFAEGNVLYANDNSDAGFNYIVVMTIEGGPGGGGSAVPFPSSGVMQDSEFNTDDPSMVYNGGMTAIDLDLKGRKLIDGSWNYYRDNTTNMSVKMYLDNGQAFSNTTYTIVDIDMDFTSNGSNYDYQGAYIDQVQILSGAGTNVITPYNSNTVKVVGDLARANFTDNNNNNIPDQHEFIQSQAFDPSGNITVNTPGTVSNISFVYSDFSLGIEGDPDVYHDFDSGNQRVGLGRYITFESGCQVIEICDDGIDNDGDGDLDCDDSDCNPVITFLSATNTDNCPLLDNGTISISAVGTDLEYSVDGGVTFSNDPNFVNLSGGSYNVVVQNSITGCNTDYAFNPVVIADPVCVEICDDGIDNDGNGLTDCEDPACDPGEITNVVTVDPSNCPTNDNGQITITAIGSDLQYSIDGGATWQTSNVFSNLPARNYTVVIRTGPGACLGGYPANPITLLPSNCPCVGVDYTFSANFENTSNDNAWTFTNGAGDGNFLIGAPNTYNTSGVIMEIVPYRGAQDLLTGNGYSQDLDGGPTIARSRNIDLDPLVTDIDLNLQYYFSHLYNSSASDYMYVEVLDADNDNVLTTVVSEFGTPSDRNAIWTAANADLTAHAGKTVYIRVRSADLAGGSKLEVAIDDIQIISTPDVSLDLPLDNLCLQSGSVVLSGGSPEGGVYSGPGISDGITFDPSALGTGSYNITYSYTASDGCLVSDTDVIIVGDTDISAAASDSEICLGESTTISASGTDGTGPYSYEWNHTTDTGAIQSVSPAVSTQYTVTVTDTYGCTASTFVNVIVNQPPSVDLNVSGSLCFDSGNTQLETSASGGTPAYTYEYSGPSGFSSTVLDPVVPSAGTYYVTVTDSKGCTAINSVEVLDPFVATATADDDDICYGQSVILTAGPDGLDYQWNATAGGVTTQDVSVSPLVTTSYAVTVTDANGCTSESSVTVTVNPLPEISISSDVSTTCDGTDVNISVTVDNSMAGNSYAYAWSSGQTTPNITVSPSTTTTYTVVVSDNNGCQATEDITITINDAEIENVALGSNVDCDGSCTGTMSVDVDYASTGPFSIFYDYEGFTYSAGPFDFGADPDTAIVIGDLCAGEYTNITVQGQNTGCTDAWVGEINISESHADWEHVNLTSDVSNCSGVCDGSFTVDANLGVTGEFEISYTYNGNVITDGPYNFAGDILIDGLCEGVYSDITITSLETGCQDVWPTDIEILTPDPQATVVANVDDDCQIGEGSVTINVSGGAIPYTIYWKSEDGSETGSEVFNFNGNHTIYGLSGGTTYCFEVVDSNGCGSGGN